MIQLFLSVTALLAHTAEHSRITKTLLLERVRQYLAGGMANWHVWLLPSNTLFEYVSSCEASCQRNYNLGTNLKPGALLLLLPRSLPIPADMPNQLAWT